MPVSDASPGDRSGTAEADRAFAAYERAREMVRAQGPQIAGHLNGVLLMRNASPTTVALLRRHVDRSGAITDTLHTDDRRAAREVARRLKLLSVADRKWLIVPESQLLGGAGVEMNGRLYSSESLTYSECLLAMSLGCVLPREAGRRTTVWEIGARWGGLAYQFKTLFPNTTYVISDSPEWLILSATYLMTAFPNMSFAFYAEGETPAWTHEDFVFVPHGALPTVTPPQIDLTVCIDSWEEMSEQEADAYARHAWHQGCPFLYTFRRQPTDSRAEHVVASYFWPHRIRLAYGKVEPSVRHTVGWRRIRR
jgi:putative sugar O-methyltransferase